MLHESGYTVLVAQDGAKAIEVVECHTGPLDLILCDVVMPHMGGKQLAERLCALRPNVKVLYTSGYTDDAVSYQNILDPGVSFIQKPYDFDSLLSKIREMLDQK
jgi:two-component system, cell cycle sensor histidine kinase and response regulator CckA